MKGLIRWLNRFNDDISYSECFRQYEHEILTIAVCMMGAYTFMSISGIYGVISWIPN